MEDMGKGQGKGTALHMILMDDEVNYFIIEQKELCNLSTNLKGLLSLITAIILY